MSDADYAEGLLQCPHCEEKWDDLMNRPALKDAGWNPKGGDLYDCRACGQRVTEAELETGKQTSQLVEEGYFDNDQ